MEHEKVKQPLKVFGWAAVLIGLFCWTMHTARYWTDFAYALGAMLFWLNVKKERKTPEISDDIGDYYRRKIWKQEQPLLLASMIGLLLLAVTQFPFFYTYYKARNVVRNLIFLELGVCMVWLVVLLIRRDFGRASKRTQMERETLHQIHEGAKQKREIRAIKKETRQNAKRRQKAERKKGAKK